MATADLDRTWPRLAQEMVAALCLEEGPIARALRETPRHRFVPRPEWAMAYADTPLPIGPNATISAPHMVAMQLAWADLRPGMNVGEFGSGSGYLCALLADMVGPGGRVVGVELEPGLVRSSRVVLGELGLGERVRIDEGDADLGVLAGLRFDRIVVSYAQPWPMPRTWHTQLQIDGALIAPVIRPEGTFLERLRPRLADWSVEQGPACLFVARKSGHRE